MNPFFAFTNLRHLVPAAGLCVGLLCLLLLPSVQAQDDGHDPLDLFNEAQNAHEKGDLAAAIGLYQAALKAHTEFPEAEFQLASAFVQASRMTDAEAAIRRAVKLKPQWSLALAKLGEILVRKYIDLPPADRTERGAVTVEAMDILSQAVSLDPNNYPAFVALTDLKFASNASPESLRTTLTQLRRLTDGKMNAPALVWAARARIEAAVGDPSLARLAVRRALEADPTNLNALIEAVESELADGDASRADGYVRLIEGHYPGSTWAVILRARVLLTEGNITGALKVLDAMRDPSPGITSLREQIISANTSDVGELEKRLALDPKDVVALGKLCTRLRLDRPGKALEYCRRASEAEPDNISYAVGFGAALVQAKRFIEAIDLFKKLLTAAPDNQTARANLATALFQLQRFEEAKREYYRIIEKQPTLAVAYYFLAISHDRLEEYVDALSGYMEFIKLADPELNRLEIEKVNLRLPVLRRQIKDKKGKRK